MSILQHYWITLKSGHRRRLDLATVGEVSDYLERSEKDREFFKLLIHPLNLANPLPRETIVGEYHPRAETTWSRGCATVPTKSDDDEMVTEWV